ncbi:hypothetical protein VTN02DRAFT_4428 [Thermoascus thermophilus]
MALRSCSSFRALGSHPLYKRYRPILSSGTAIIDNRRLPSRQYSQSLVRPVSTTPTEGTTSSLPPLSHVLETCLYVRDLPASVQFYRDNLLLEPFLESPRMSGFSLGQTTLLLFQLGPQTASSIPTPTGLIPGHGPSEPITSALLDIRAPGANDVALKQHFCLAVREPADVARWEEHLRRRGVRVTGRMEWARGGRSVYFEDLDGHVGEVGSRGIWGHY